MTSAISRAEVSFPMDAHAAFAAVEDSSYWFQHRNRVIEAVVRNHPPPEGLMLDVGGGTGVVAAHLRKAGFRNLVIEPDSDGAARARARGLDVVEGALDDWSDPAADVAATCFFDVIEHIENADGVLARAFAVTKPDGMLYITVPSHAWLWSNEDVLAGHFRRYTTATLRSTIERAGFEPVFSTYFFGFLVAPIALMRVLPSALGLRVGHSCEASAEAHAMPPEPLASLMRWTFARELAGIGDRRELSLGSSIVLAARKP